MSTAITIAECPPGFDLEKWRGYSRLQCLRILVFERDGYTCRHCDLYIPDERPITIGWKGKFDHVPIKRWLQLDHIIPTSKGGLDTVENGQALCNICNARKGDRVRPNGPVGWDARLIPVRWVNA